jgi:hypothetical protein
VSSAGEIPAKVMAEGFPLDRGIAKSLLEASFDSVLRLCGAAHPAPQADLHVEFKVQVENVTFPVPTFVLVGRKEQEQGKRVLTGEAELDFL